ncbi:hypothetical protein Ppa06_57150 [Planomonospora parontospora subsp. parontospora]|uniref:Uncharacterized protein n=2 Tax=Planomonospora parontospora TaxID=58119 RepID=A0AA37BM46_9ACTN|nr:hypothetical protein [Planomonospora parontospora]GGK91099.1 hypothetical protein GCM10010126_58150 [Planomonospora parontospora]GII11917.1 hypothetical protein Ppa06_57150 [Planomonospora parontospora subsp. parontospora]
MIPQHIGRIADEALSACLAKHYPAPLPEFTRREFLAAWQKNRALALAQRWQLSPDDMAQAATAIGVEQLARPD